MGVLDAGNMNLKSQLLTMRKLHVLCGVTRIVISKT